MIESVQRVKNPTLIDVEGSLAYCVERLCFVSDGVECDALTDKGLLGISHIVGDVRCELEAILEIVTELRKK